MREEISKLHWVILDSLSDDSESLVQLRSLVSSWIPDVPLSQIIAALRVLLDGGLVRLDQGMSFDPADVQKDINREHEAKYWFELTEAGSEIWESLAGRYTGRPIDWSAAFALCYVSPEQGHVDGVSEAVCIDALRQCEEMIPNFKVDWANLHHTEIDGFYAKHHKRIAGGHRIGFRLL